MNILLFVELFILRKILRECVMSVTYTSGGEMSLEKAVPESSREDILKKCFDCLTESGLEQTTIRTLCEATGLTASSLYYRFNDKDDIVFEAAFYGLETITKELFWLAVQNVDNFEELFQSFLAQLELLKMKIKLIYQVAASPKYGERFRAKATTLTSIYDKYTVMLSKHLHCSDIGLRPYVNLFIAVVREYVVWDNKAHVQEELQFIYDKAVEFCGGEIGKENNQDKQLFK